MRGIFGAVALLVVLAIVGVLAMKQLRAVNGPVGASLPPAQGGDVAAAAAIIASTAAAQSTQLKQRVGDEVGRALEQGAARTEAADK